MLNEEWLKSFVPIGILKNPTEWIAIGAGIFFHKAPVVWIITAHHVIRDAGQYPITILVRGREKGKTILLNLTDIHSKHKLEWVIDEKTDVAATLMPLSPNIELKAITDNNCLQFENVVPSMNCLTIGCPYGLHSFDPQSNVPLVMDGVIAGKNTAEQIIYTTAPTFPGNSGGPLIIMKNPFNPSGGVTIGLPTVYLCGIIKDFGLVHNESAKTKGYPPLHVGIATPVDRLLELLHSEKATELTAKTSKTTIKA